MNESSEFNAFFGAEAGGAGTSGNGNSFFGAGAGFSNDGELNSFFGNGAGSMGSGGNLNSFFGAGAGRSNISSNNAFFGAFSGVLNVTGGNNAFFGFESGWQNENACCNSFFGSRAGRMNTSGGGNAFFGNRAGQSNTNACCNTYIGDQAGDLSTTGTNNVFVGAGAGDTNTTGSDNTIVGAFAGSFHSTGTGNTFVGRDAGDAVTTGQNNTFIGIGTDHANGGFRSFGTAIGAFAKTTNDSSTAIGNRSYVEGFNSIVLGSIAGINGAQSTAKVGIGLTMPQASLHIRDNSGDIKLGSPFSCVAGFAGIGFGPNFNCQTYALLGGDGNTIINRSGGGIIQFRESNVAQVTINAGGTVSISALGSGGSTQLCRNASNTISTCSSSLKYKTGLTGFQSGMSFVNRLRPISFNWKEDGLKDVGFGAEDLAAIDPRFVTLNDRGEVEGVKYDRLSTVFVNAFKEQEKEIDDLRAQVGALKKLVCSTNRDADICR